MHIRIDLEEVIDKIADALSSKKPYSVMRIGDGEIDVINGKVLGFTLWCHPGNNHVRQESAPFLVEQTRKAVAESDVIGIFEGDYWTYDALKAGNCDIEGKPEFFAFGNLHLCTRKKFVDTVFRNSRVALVGLSMPQYNNLVKSKIPDAKTIVYGGNCMIYTKLEYDGIINFLRSNIDNYDVALVSLGVWAEAVVGEVKRLGKAGIDFGHAADHQLIGEYPLNLEYDNLDDYYKNSKCPQCLK